MPKVYFACAVRAGGDTSSYKNLIAAIQRQGGEVLSEIFVNDAINFQGSPLPEVEIYKRDTDMIDEADIIIAEVTNPSLGVGYEIAYAETLGKPIVCLFDTTSQRNLSAMIAGNPNITLVSYTPHSIDSIAFF